MPSIPQSLLWISLVVLWLFVLVPMLINKRDTVRRTSDVALATRVVNGHAKSRLIKRSGPAAGHRHDPEWKLEDQFVEDYPDLVEAEMEFAEQRDMIRQYDDAVREARMGVRTRSMVVVAAVTEQRLTEPDYLDVDVVDENSGALPVGGAVGQADAAPESGRQETAAQAEPVVEAVTEAFAVQFDDETLEAVDPEAVDEVVEREPLAYAVQESVQEPTPEPVQEPTPEPVQEPTREAAAEDRKAEPTAAEYDYIDDTSGLEPEAEAEVPVAAAPGRSASRERRLSTTAAAAVEARKYRFRKRVLMVMGALMALSAVLSFSVSPTMWWSFGAVAGVTVLYLAYLRRQTRIEEQVRRRRQQRMARSRPVVDEPAARGPEVDEFTEFPTRLQRPGAVVLEIDDEDPVFEHLDEVAYSHRPYGRTQGPSRGSTRGSTRDLPRASGL
jgi:outer membrane biosynthesis protein TonB